MTKVINQLIEIDTQRVKVGRKTYEVNDAIEHMNVLSDAIDLSEDRHLINSVSWVSFLQLSDRFILRINSLERGESVAFLQYLHKESTTLGCATRIKLKL